MKEGDLLLLRVVTNNQGTFSAQMDQLRPTY